MHFVALMLQSAPDQEMIRHAVMALLTVLPILILIGLAVVIVPFWFICKKAGFSPWLSMLCLVPSIGMLVLLYVLAFADWKVVPAMQTAWGPPQPYPPQALAPPPNAVP